MGVALINPQKRSLQSRVITESLGKGTGRRVARDDVALRKMSQALKVNFEDLISRRLHHSILCS